MRDPRRISLVLSTLEHYWRRYPDLRLAQILGNAYDGGRPVANYNMEDDVLLARLDEWLEHGHGAKS